MGTDNREVLNSIRQIIKEVKEEMKTKKVITESKTPQKVFETRSRELYNYVLENVLKTINKTIK